MSDDRDAFHSCVDDLREDFRVHDQTVDIVSCWQSFLQHSYPDSLEYFDRFPEDPDTGLTPDFTAHFGEYGLIGEIKRTFPKNKKAFKKEMDQLIKYDQELKLQRNEGGELDTPEEQDILLILFDPSAAFQISKRVQNYLSEGEPPLEGSLVIIDSFYESSSVKSRYVFRAIPGQEMDFQDEALPGGKRLQTKLIDDQESISVYPKHFVDIKAREVLCNDQPPPLYMAVFLWTRVFYDLLSHEQRETWRLENPQKTLEIEVSPEELTARLNQEYLREGAARLQWVRKALEFLESSGLAEEHSSGYTVEYRYLTQLYGHKKHHQEGKDELMVQKECSRALADFYCKEHLSVGEDAKAEGDADTTYQQKLGEPQPERGEVD